MALSHEDLYRSPSLLLKNKPNTNESANSDAADSVIAGVINDGFSCITTSSCDFIPSPPIGSNRAVHERSDLYFGEDDFLVWPQPYHPLLPHLPFIHRRLDEIEEKDRRFLWSLPQRDDFEVTDTQFFTGMGRFCPHLLAPFRKLRESLIDRLESSYPPEISLKSQFPTEFNLFNSLQLKTFPLLNRLESLSTGFRTMCRTVRALQRNLLELEALLDLLEHRKQHTKTEPTPADQNQTPAEQAPAQTVFRRLRTVGVFVYSLDDAARFQAMGVDHWLIQPYHLVLQSKIRDVAYLQQPEHIGLSLHLSRNSPCIFVGSVSDPKLYAAITNFSNNSLRYPDPFNAVSLPEFIPASPSTPLSTGPQRRRALSAKERFAKTRSPYAKAKLANNGQRNKFEDPVHQLFPLAIPAWRDALVNVDRAPNVYVFQMCASDFGYIVPEPASLVSTQTEEKSLSMFRVWLKIRGLCLLRISLGSSLAQPLPNTSWNVILTAEYAAQKARDHEPGKRTQQRDKLRNELVSLFGNCVDGDTEIEVASSMDLIHVNASWLGIPFEQLEQVHFEQILWELHELCFHYELQALDRRARLRTPFENDTNAETLLMQCFPDNSVGIPTIDTANHGIASLSSWEQGHYLFAMARVMSRWRGVATKGLIVQTDKLCWSLKELESLEKEIAETYTQSFFNCFRRAPVVPHRLSDHAVSRNPLVGRSHRPLLAPHIENNATILINSQTV